LIFRDDRGEQKLCITDDIRIRGTHNLENVLAASAIALSAGAIPDCVSDVVREFRGVEHRLEWVAEIHGVQYFNDSKATNVDAALKSLEAFPRSIHLIAGGRDKGGDFAALRPLVEQRVKHLILIGEAAGKMREALGEIVEISEVDNLEKAVLLCRRGSVPGDVVLLAPACASFDMFEDYEQRGRIFKQVVRRLREAEERN
jgi:UDP-N-acetylmuramoylalanine--D-glutamate ligase